MWPKYYPCDQSTINVAIVAKVLSMWPKYYQWDQSIKSVAKILAKWMASYLLIYVAKFLFVILMQRQYLPFMHWPLVAN